MIVCVCLVPESNYRLLLLLGALHAVAARRGGMGHAHIVTLATPVWRAYACSTCRKQFRYRKRSIKLLYLIKFVSFQSFVICLHGHHEGKK